MFMIDMQIDAARLMRFAHLQNHPLTADGDFGYAVHAWLAATFGELALQPFRLFERRNRLQLLGYARHAAPALEEHARTFATPGAVEVCDWRQMAEKQMPNTWTPERRLGFEVRVCPVARRETEMDVYLAALNRAKSRDVTPPSREHVYFDWLVQRMQAATEPGGAFHNIRDEVHAPVVELRPGTLAITGFRRVRLLRRGKGRFTSGIERPDVLLSGELIVRDAAGFAELLQRGVGRHKAFGFGMLLLRPPGRQGSI